MILPATGWLPPTPEKREQNMRYSVALADGWGTPPAQFEKALPVPWQYYDYRRPRGYDQGPNPSCVGYSGGWGRSIDANIAGLAKYFDADWLYDQACKVGGTKQGAYIWAALKVLQDTGAVEIVNGKQQGPDPEDKIKSFVWAKTWQEIRDAIWNDCPVWFGMPWPWDRPQIKNGEAWVGLTWPTAKYGHAITGFTWSDSRQAAGLVQTWGSAWPRITWFGADAITAMFKKGGEAAIVLDQYVKPGPTPPPPPPPPPGDKFVTTIKIAGIGKFTGTLTREE